MHTPESSLKVLANSVTKLALRNYHLKKARIASLIILSSVMVTSGCADHLSRSSAREKIESAIQNNLLFKDFATKQALLQIGHIDDYCYVSGFNLGNDREYIAMTRAALITVESTGPNAWNVALTDAGKGAVAGKPYGHEQLGACDFWQVNIPVAVVDDVDVTGVHEENATAKVEVILTWKRTNAGIALKKQWEADNRKDAIDWVSVVDALRSNGPDLAHYRTSEAFLFNKYDDGWRLKF